ncbi:MAG: hypothetical protein Q7K42_00175, partial [Candidatus Diapherotrites archaeon]|nr:hypothetical protein [Candidatus Diapherotrites archaeon]
MSLTVMQFQKDYLKEFLHNPTKLDQLKKLRELSKPVRNTSRIRRELGRPVPVETDKAIARAKQVSTTNRYAKNPAPQEFIDQVQDELSAALVEASEASPSKIREICAATLDGIIKRETARVAVDPSQAKSLVSKVSYLNQLRKGLMEGL